MPESVEITESIMASIDQHRLLPAGGIVIVAVSGGADSLCLLHLLHRLCGEGRRYPDVRLHAAHLDHQLRGEQSAREAAAVAALVEQWGLPITTGQCDVPALARAEHRSIEDAARLARYRFLRDVARQAATQAAQETQGGPGEQPEVFIAVAHHADDQVETLLLHWLRGSGLPGMVGMQPRQQDIIRPLLGITHAQTVEYCRQQGIIPIEDASNADPAYTRNRVRHQLLPLLESINPGFRAALLRNAGVIAVDLAFIEAQVDACWPQVVASPVSDHDSSRNDNNDNTMRLCIPPLLELPLSIQRHLLRRMAERLCAGQSPLEARHYALIEHLLRLPPDRQPRELHLPGGLRLTRIKDIATLERLPVVPLGVEDTQSCHAERSEASPGTSTETLRYAQGDTSFWKNPHRVPLTGSEVHLAVPGEVIVPGTRWLVRAERLPGDIIEQVKAALRREDWQRVWQLLPTSRSVVYVDAASAGESLLVRTRRPGDRLQPLGMAGEKKVQDILMDAHIPRSDRDTIPLLFAALASQNGAPMACVWLAGVCLDQRARLTVETEDVVRLSLIPV